MDIFVELPKHVAPGECLKVIREKGVWHAQIVELVTGRVIREVSAGSPAMAASLLITYGQFPPRTFQLTCDGEPVITGTMTRIQEFLASQEDLTIGAALERGYDITAARGD